MYFTDLSGFKRESSPGYMDWRNTAAGGTYGEVWRQQASRPGRQSCRAQLQGYYQSFRVPGAGFVRHQSAREHGLRSSDAIVLCNEQRVLEIDEKRSKLLGNGDVKKVAASQEEATILVGAVPCKILSQSVTGTVVAMAGQREQVKEVNEGGGQKRAQCITGWDVGPELMQGGKESRTTSWGVRPAGMRKREVRRVRISGWDIKSGIAVKGAVRQISESARAAGGETSVSGIRQAKAAVRSSGFQAGTLSLAMLSDTGQRGHEALRPLSEIRQRVLMAGGQAEKSMS